MKLPDLKTGFIVFLSYLKHLTGRVDNVVSSKSNAPKTAKNIPDSSPDLPSVSRFFPNLTAQDFLKHLKSLKLKTKIHIGLIVLFAGITLLGAMGGYYIQKTSSNTGLMMRENQNSIKYVLEMNKAINEMVLAVTLENSSPAYRRQALRKAGDNFEVHLNLQLAKVTDPQEIELSNELKRNFESLLDALQKSENSTEVRFTVFMKIKHIQTILESVQEMNQRMMAMRNEDSNEMANHMTFYMVLLGFFFFVFALFALFYFPHYITDPIESMTQSIQQIAQKNYSERLIINHRDELGEMARSFNKMAQKLEEYENINVAQILTEKKRTETIVSRMKEAIIGLDDRKRILFANPPALELLGLSESVLIGKDAKKYSQHHPLLKKLLQEVLSNEVTVSKSFTAISIDKDGKRQYFNKDVLRVEGQAEDDHLPTNVGYVVILKNITELKEQDLAKTNFMATLSHELKTPISAIDMSLNLLKDVRIGNLNEEQKDLANTIRQNSTRLLKLVNEILDISRIESGKLNLTFAETQPDEVVIRALDNVKTFIAEKHLEVIQHIEPELPSIKMDLPKTTAVLVNFLTNAVRYTPVGEAIEINVLRQNGSIKFYVKDHGPGISAEEQKKLFQPYRRASGDKTTGTGLGLAISKEFVEAQGGRIWVESKVGVGSKFGFALPVKS